MGSLCSHDRGELVVGDSCPHSPVGGPSCYLPDSGRQRDCPESPRLGLSTSQIQPREEKGGKRESGARGPGFVLTSKTGSSLIDRAYRNRQTTWAKWQHQAAASKPKWTGSFN